MTNLEFKYDPEYEYKNFSAAFKSLNHQEPSPRQKLFFSRYAELTPANAAQFSQWYCRQNNIITSHVIKQIIELWTPISERFFTRAEKIYAYQLPIKTIDVYFTVHDRCSYNFEKSYFFIHNFYPTVNRTIMHELWHWFFHFTVGQKVLEQHGKTKYNDIKESLTVLLNEEFADLMPGIRDLGYPQHQELREKILNEYRTAHDIYQTIERTLSM